MAPHGIASPAPEETADRTDTAIAALARGGAAVLTQEGGGPGFVVAAAQTIAPELIALMLREARGMTWLALPDERCRALGLEPIPYRSSTGERDESIARDFMVSIEAHEGTTTGISAADRALTMRVAADPASVAGDVVSPGHITPIRARDPQAPQRPGIVEAAVELAALAGFPGGAAMCELLDEQGEIASGAQVERRAGALGLPLVDELDVLDRLLPRRALVAVHEEGRTLAVGGHSVRAVVFADRFYGAQHVALVCGDPAPGDAATVEALVQDPLLDVFDPRRRNELTATVERLARMPPAVLAYVSNVAALRARRPDADQEAQREALLATRRQPYVVAQMLERLGLTPREAALHA